MAKLSFFIQAATAATHAAALNHIFASPDPNQLLISVAFASEGGVKVLEESLEKIGPKARAFIGIRNDITSAQAINRLIDLGIQVYAVDTGSRHIIFHPKIYLLVSEKSSFAVIGSANLTFNGLHNNIEASTVIELDKSFRPDQEFIDEILIAFDQLVRDHPQHAFRVADKSHANELFLAGLLVDERIIRAPAPIASAKDPVGGETPPMRLSWTAPPTKPSESQPIAPIASAMTHIAATVTRTKYLVWKSKPLSERDLNIPSGEATNATGSMGLKKGLFDQIDQRHYFHDTVFAGLAWQVGTRSTIVKTNAQFELIIANVNYGIFILTVSHNTSTTSATYLQNNFVSNLHWNEAKQHIARPSLLGRTLSLFREDSAPPQFTIEID